MSVHSLSRFSNPAAMVAPSPDSSSMTSPESFETYRSYLFSIAYRMLGSVMDAEDMVQETYLRYGSAAPATIVSLKAYLTTIITRLCIDQLHLAYRQRETYVGPWLPEPILTAHDAPQAEEETVMRESLTIAFLTVLEQLQPLERAVFLLREVFDYDYPDIAAFVGRKEPACRQIFSRAKKRLSSEQARSGPSTEMHRRLLQAYLDAARSGDTGRLMDLLAEDVTLVADSGGKIPAASLKPVKGRSAVARFSVAVRGRFLALASQTELSEINHQPAIIVREAGRPLVVMTIEVESGRVRTVRFMANPDKLTRV